MCKKLSEWINIDDNDLGYQLLLKDEIIEF